MVVLYTPLFKKYRIQQKPYQKGIFKKRFPLYFLNLMILLLEFCQQALVLAGKMEKDERGAPRVFFSLTLMASSLLPGGSMCQTAVQMVSHAAGQRASQTRA
jgi:hypothetical protein